MVGYVTSQPCIALEDVTVRRSDTDIVRFINWTVEPGQRWVVLGPNGAGKTTTLQICATLIHPTSGKATILGGQLGKVDVFELRPRIGLASAALAALVPDSERALDVVMTAGWAVLGRWTEEYDNTDTDRAMQLLKLLGADHLADRRFGTLSEGERKRVQIARALMPDPELLLLDEPAAGMDLAGREDLLARISEISDDPFAPTLVLVTHHVEEIPIGITHALLLKSGGVVASGPVAEVLTPPLLSETFGIPLVVDRYGGRWSARAPR